MNDIKWTFYSSERVDEESCVVKLTAEMLKPLQRNTGTLKLLLAAYLTKLWLSPASLGGDEA